MLNKTEILSITFHLTFDKNTTKTADSVPSQVS